MSERDYDQKCNKDYAAVDVAVLLRFGLVCQQLRERSVRPGVRSVVFIDVARARAGPTARGPGHRTDLARKLLAYQPHTPSQQWLFVYGRPGVSQSERPFSDVLVRRHQRHQQPKPGLPI